MQKIFSSKVSLEVCFSLLGLTEEVSYLVTLKHVVLPKISKKIGHSPNQYGNMVQSTWECISALTENKNKKAG